MQSASVIAQPRGSSRAKDSIVHSVAQTTALGKTPPVPQVPSVRTVPTLATITELFKPITWFPPMWAFFCGVVASGFSFSGRWLEIIVGVVLAGPLVCATSQAVNDWFDRHVDAINEPNRPIPSGRMPGRWGLFLAIVWTIVSLLVAMSLGVWGFGAAACGLLLAWAYSAPPVRLKLNGWWGNAVCGLSYEGLAWATGAAVMAGGAMPNGKSLLFALLYSISAHGIMTLNDFKAIAGDKQMGVRSLPVQLGADNAAQVACWIMATPQVVVVAALISYGLPWFATSCLVLLLVQTYMMQSFLRDPIKNALYYSGFGVPVFVSGMMVSAFALRATL